MNFSIVNLGCKVNRVESDAVALSFLQHGAQESETALADVIVVNTCTVTGEAEKKTRKAVRAALKANDFARVVVTGCAAAINAEVFTQMSPRVEVVSKFDLQAHLESLLSTCLPENAPVASLVNGGHHDRVGVKIQDGCNHACTYCIVHVARGKSYSSPVDEIVKRCVSLAQSGVREIVLTGIDLASYCSVHDGSRVRLSDLIELLLEVTSVYVDDAGRACRFRIGSVEPMSVDEALIACMQKHQGRVCWHLHMPLQSGSTKVLQEMDRPYTALQFVSLVEQLYVAMPSLSLSTDIIVGFPGESEDDFKESCEIARRCRFSKIHVFPYSRREGTPAAARSDQVPAEIISSRAKTLRLLASELRQLELEKRQGSTELAVVEDGAKAMTDSYYEIAVSQEALRGTYVELTL